MRARRHARRDRPERRGHRARRRASRARSAGAGRRGIVFGMALSVASTVVLDPRPRRQPTTCTRRPGTSPSAGWSSRTCSRCSCWCCCRRCSAGRGGARRSWLGAGAGGRSRSAPWSAFTVRRRRRGSSRGVLDHVARDPLARAVHADRAGASRSASPSASALVFGVSMALGAFLAGMVVGRSEFSLRAASDALPMRDAFAVLFFVSVGMLLDPAALLDDAGAARRRAGGRPGRQAAGRRWSIVSAAALSARRSALAVGDRAGADRRVLVHPRRRSASELGVLPAGGDQRAGRGRRSSRSSLNPLLYRAIEPIERWAAGAAAAVARSLNRRRRRTAGEPAAAAARARRRRAHRAVVVGYGPVGRTVTRLLRENDIEPTVIELNMETVRELREAGIDGGLRRRDTAARR